MPKVTTIPPRKQRNHAVTSQETRRIRVAAYCRVSTDTEEQATSSNITRRLSVKIRNGYLPESMQMMVLAQPQRKTERNLIK